MSKPRLYFDYAASTPVDPRVELAMRPYFKEKFGNPGSLHSFGQEAIAAVDSSREAVARSIGADFREVIFTGSATEANNLALRGVAKAVKPAIKKPRVVVSVIEHESILETAHDLEREGVEIIYLPVDRGGIVDLKELKNSLNERTVLVSIMYANNEIGSVQPIVEISKIISDFRVENASMFGAAMRPSGHGGPTTFGPSDGASPAKPLAGRLSGSQIQKPFPGYPLFHTDTVQAFQFFGCDVNKLGVDLMTISAHKIYGPKGIGALYLRKGVALDAIVTGGGQEFGLRPGTENVPLVVGLAKAVELLFSDGARLPAGRQEREAERIGALRDYFWRELKKVYSKTEINGPEENLERLPNILNVYFPDYKSEELLTKFDLAGLAASSGSACRSRAVESSYVIEALGYSNGSTKLTARERAKRSIRFSFGRPTTKEELDLALGIIKMGIKK